MLTYICDCGRGMLSDLHEAPWILLPPISQFEVSLLNCLNQILLHFIKSIAMEFPVIMASVLFFVLMNDAFFY